ncbi:hypothetical protein RhiirA4_476286 [Rhizophagus irregularis]|uniref:Uncharacterized protein n=1 Tax=Rhizophagus irregularis TaxID=588596 RepID=A0A2I1HBI0_9GLOM|nr:hypothetical protein RhiirA4_476286 [Rhizophagus irregularis]
MSENDSHTSLKNLFKTDEYLTENVKYEIEDDTTKKEDYQIAICQDGKFAVTFDTEGGVNVSITRKNRTFFLRMFDSKLAYAEVKEKFRWQASKELGEDVCKDDVKVIKEYVKTYHAFFGKIIRVNGMRFLILYFNRETDLMKAINDAIELHDIGNGLWIKKPTDFIDNNGNIKDLEEEYGNGMEYQNGTSSASGFSMGRQQQDRNWPRRRHANNGGRYYR